MIYEIIYNLCGLLKAPIRIIMDKVKMHLKTLYPFGEWAPPTP